MPTVQENLIGVHPTAPDIIGVWLTATDMPVKPNQRHRKLEEDPTQRQLAIDTVGQWVVDQIVHDSKKDLLARKSKILAKYDFDKLVGDYHLLPIPEKTQRGDVAEILLVEYLKHSKGYSPIVYKLQYNPNVDQSMKGDDCLLFNMNNLTECVIYGESKFRSAPSKAAIEQAVSNLQGEKKLPNSLSFISNILAERGDTQLSEAIMDLLIRIKDSTTPVINVGFLMSTKSNKPGQDTSSMVETHLDTLNPNLVFVSLGIDDPQGFVKDVMAKANEILRNP